MTDGAAQSSSCTMAPRRSLFCKYFATLLVAAVVPLILAARPSRRLSVIRTSAARSARCCRPRTLRASTGSRHSPTASGISWVGGAASLVLPETMRNIRIDALRLLQQVPAIVSVSLLDEAGTERVFVSRLHLNRTGRGIDMSTDPAVLGARANKVWYGPVQYQRDSEPYMRIAVAGNLPAAGVAIAEVNLKLIWDVIAAIRIGETGYAIVVDNSGHLIAHPDISLVLRGRASSGSFGRIKHLVGAASAAAVITGDQGKPVVALSVQAADVGWTVIAMQPVSEAFASIRAALWRSSILIVFGVLIALALAYWRAHRMSGPIKQLEDGVERIRTGQFEHRIKIFSGDELQQLALRFNEMASELAISQQKSARIERLKQFLPSQVAELVERSHELLEGQRREVAVIFGDLRGFTAFSSRNEPDVIMAVMREYYEAVGAVTTRHEATLIGFDGDGVMLLVNAPVACEQPATQAVRLRDRPADDGAVHCRQMVRRRPRDRLWCGRCHGTGNGRNGWL